MALLGSPRRPLEVFWESLWGPWGGPGRSLGALHDGWGIPGGTSGSPWGYLGADWRSLGGCSGRIEMLLATLEPIEKHLFLLSFQPSAGPGDTVNGLWGVAGGPWGVPVWRLGNPWGYLGSPWGYLEIDGLSLGGGSGRIEIFLAILETIENTNLYTVLSGQGKP